MECGWSRKWKAKSRDIAHGLRDSSQHYLLCEYNILWGSIYWSNGRALCLSISIFFLSQSHLSTLSLYRFDDTLKFMIESQQLYANRKIWNHLLVNEYMSYTINLESYGYQGNNLNFPSCVVSIIYWSNGMALYLQSCNSISSSFICMFWCNLAPLLLFGVTFLTVFFKFQSHKEVFQL